MIVGIDYENQTIYYKYFLTHAEYDKGKWKNDSYLTFDTATYSNLLDKNKFIPKVIETEEEYDLALVLAEKLTFANFLLIKLQVTIFLIVVAIEN